MPDQVGSPVHAPPEWLWHYTSSDALERILDSKVLWATHVRFLNDWSEYYHAIEECDRILGERLDADPPIGQRRLYEELRPNLRIWDREEAFVTSFSADGDHLGQWRGYCPNGGVAVGFRGVDLAALGYLAPCVYYEDEVREVLNGFLDRMLQRGEHYGVFGGPGPGYPTVYDWWRTAPLIKRKEFADEKEWRVIRLRHHDYRDDDKYRRRGSLYIPYLERQLPPTAVDPVSGAWKNNVLHVRSSPVPAEQKNAVVQGLRGMLRSRTGTFQHASVSDATFRYV